MKFPSKSDFLEGFRTFERTILQEKQKLTSSIGELQDDYPLIDEIVKRAIPFLPAPFNGIAQALYDSFAGSKKDKLDGLLNYLHDIERQTDEQYAEITSKLGNILGGVSDLQTIVAKQETLQTIKEILIGTSAEAYEKMDELRDEIALMHVKLEQQSRLVSEARDAVLAATQRLDDTLLPRIKNQTVDIGVIAEKQGDDIFFISVDSRQIRGSIKRADFEKLDSRRLATIIGYEQLMEDKLKQWNLIDEQRDTLTDLDRVEKRREIAQIICTSWSGIVKCLGEVRYKLDDHYKTYVNVCEREGLLEIPHSWT